MHGGFRRVRRRMLRCAGIRGPDRRRVGGVQPEQPCGQAGRNPTTGYEWTFQIDGSAVQPDGDEFVPASDGAQPKTGEGGVHTFNFKADGSGEATLTFTYARSWEASDSDKTVVLHATVENGAFTQVEEQA